MTKVRLIDRNSFNENTEEVINRELDSLCRDGYYIRDVKFCRSNTHSGFMIIYDTEEK